MAEIHIFDFDGTLFYSPAPTRAAVASLARQTSLEGATAAGDDASTAAGTPSVREAKEREREADRLYGSLINPVDAGGYGWFQSLCTMSPPFVPAAPDPSVWFVMPILTHMRALVGRRNAALHDPHATAADTPLFYVLTGRDVKYADRIWTLLQHVGLDTEVEDVIVKPHETAGTVKYKLNNFFKIIQHHRPSRVFYYEDRVEQGGRLFEGIRVLEEVLYGTENGSGGGGSAVGRVGVVTFDVEASENAPAGPPTLGSACHSPQPVVTYRFGAVAARSQPPSAAEADPRHLLLTSHLRASPYRLLREACYPLDHTTAFYQGETSEHAAKAAAHAARQAWRWVESTIAFWNSKSATGRGRGGRGSRGRGRAGGPARQAPESEFDARALHDAIHFNVAPPFAFIMVLIPPAIADRSNYMLSPDQFAALVERLTAARDARVAHGAAASTH
ncbi:putative mitochondrial hypothetical protein [Leptomonas pyrrhocoris]|uniref:Swiss Army Knife RNA repair protein HAD domain-containing protein n=1 Tax=Leptomonas pyrrhocoris TaxID=157538 RepID=A0A0M9G7F7_LEPPY|nr:putative mitochondrial hypothetical protein [Leptomonas pyrrhocoris]XP_015662343.1 putative mitochondrial hypothetical protein [Leptomonas pyrrhocoris]XP_015662344.1 putative mitochondrial hypothetical protein [Leptomonas pyrrhocoris]XP_015662345.1 putative mitochondrial hypothetical protein [Leptomonas pyrrhocoris]KPA83903.1 putative mitochondrial hypothetical protein [Leptomonas pyrrhocoris]KPA83904.1 putative mitochondrial hypothetical protein [Leptomonas pyrrhocoris]KPA83905.1 putative|eukprot:XP_015662342.1 putative mitochondrial hypothetical protein [Leptomonas pyrrhocoris]